MENVIMYENEHIVGYKNDVIKALKSQVVTEVTNYIDELDAEELQTNVDMLLEIIGQIENECGSMDLIIVKYNPMGAYYYEKIEIVELNEEN